MQSYRTIAGFLLVLGFCSIGFAQTQKVIIKKEMSQSDSLHEDIKIVHSGALSDSTMKKVIVHKSPKVMKKVARIIVKESGLFKKKKIVIDFDPVSREILKVIENDEEIPSSKFHKYQDYVDDTAEMSELKDLQESMQHLELKVEMSDLSDSEKLADLDKLILELEHMESDHAVMKKEHYRSIKKVIELDNLTETIQQVIESAGQTPPQKIKELEIKKGKFYLNGEEIKGEVGQKCIQAYAELSDLTVDDLQAEGGLFKEDISVHIIFD